MTIPIYDLTDFKVRSIDINVLPQRALFQPSYAPDFPISRDYGQPKLNGSVSFVCVRHDLQRLASILRRSVAGAASLLFPLGQDWIGGNPRLAEGVTQVTYAWSTGYSWSSGYSWAVIPASEISASLQSAEPRAIGDNQCLVEGGAPSRVLRAGQWVSFGPGLSHQLTESVTFNSQGRATLVFTPPLTQAIEQGQDVTADITVYGYLTDVESQSVQVQDLGPVQMVQVNFVQDMRPLS